MSKSITHRRLATRDTPELYPTKAWGTWGLLEHVSFDGTIHEPACGDGRISRVLEQSGYEVESSDLYAQGYGIPYIDFLSGTSSMENIVTNPPYKLADQFTRVALQRATKKVALLFQLRGLEGQKKYKNIYSVNKPNLVLIFSERLTFWKKEPGNIFRTDGTAAHMWLIWDKENPDEHGIDWIAPGCQERYEKETGREGNMGYKPVSFSPIKRYRKLV